jgi:hypothetical protein
MPYNLEKDRRFGGTYRLNLSVEKQAKQETSKKVTGKQRSYKLYSTSFRLLQPLPGENQTGNL